MDSRMTLEEILAEGTGLLASSMRASSKRASSGHGSSHIETPGLDAALLLAEVLGTNREGLFVRGKEQVSPEDRIKYNSLLERRLDGECIAYILGRKEFYGLEFIVTPDVLVPRPDTETLVEAALEILKERKNKGPPEVLDLCTGSGAIAIVLKHEIPELKIWASDISPQALKVARQNGVKHLLSGSASHQIQFMESDLFSNIKGRFDLIISNPPYVASAEIEKLTPEVRREPILALDGGEDGLDCIRRIAAEAKNHLHPGGTLLMEADPGQMEKIRGLLEKNGFIKCRTYRDLSEQLRVMGGSLP